MNAPTQPELRHVERQSFGKLIEGMKKRKREQKDRGTEEADGRGEGGETFEKAKE